MISQLEGKIEELTDGFVIISVNGVGYKVYVTSDTVKKLGEKVGEKIILKTHLAVRETALDLYGFLENEDLRFFEMLISISGIGPKSALAILSVADTKTLRKAVSAEDSSYLTKVSGIGKKNAEKIIIELRDKIGAIDNAKDSALLKDEMETLEALEALGYSAGQAREALKNIPKSATNTNERLKEALKTLGK